MESREQLNQRIYDFILKSLRESDQKNGKLLERYLDGPQDVWTAIQEKIFSLKTLWDYTKIDDELLKYMKNIVGWTTELDYITDHMSYEQLRRLISISVAFWKKRGTEDSIEDILRFILFVDVRIITWFDYRWLIDENYLTLENRGFDTWLLDLPEEGTEQNYSVLKVVDDGTLDRTLLKNFLGMMRPVGERIEIYYMLFMDLFETVGYDAKWDAFTNGTLADGALDVTDGTAKLSDNTTTQSAFISSSDTASWGKFMFSTKLRANETTTGEYGVWINAQDSIDPADEPTGGFKARLDVANNLVWFDSESVSFGPIGTLYPNVWYDLTVRVRTLEDTSVQYDVSVDGESLLSVNRNTDKTGRVGVYHDANAVLELGEVDVFPIPTETELIDINS